MAPPRPFPVRVVVFIDGQNLFHRCRQLFGHPWVHPRLLGEALVQEDQSKYGPESYVLCGVRYYSGFHDLGRNANGHRRMARRLHAYSQRGVSIFTSTLRYAPDGRAREKGIDVRLSLDLVRLGQKGLYDVAILASEDSDFDPAVQAVYALRDEERWIAVENALPWAPRSHPRWIPSAKRHRRITKKLFDRVKDLEKYPSSPATDVWSGSTRAPH